MLDLQLKHGTGLGVLRALAPPAPAEREGDRAHQLRDSRSTATRSLALGADYFFDKSREYHRVRDVLDRLRRNRALTRDVSAAPLPGKRSGRARLPAVL